jgi:hypothetical protein
MEPTCQTILRSWRGDGQTADLGARRAARGSFSALCREDQTNMTKADEIIRALIVDPDVVLQFFAVFSRFEYSLKRSGFLKHGDRAEANWGMYANSLRGHFGRVQDEQFQGAVTFLLREPPKTQIVSGVDLGWRDTAIGDGEYHERYVLRLVGTVRNNLFHGGKYPIPVGPMDDVARNKRLLEASLTVLKQCLELSDTVRATFEEAA